MFAISLFAARAIGEDEESKADWTLAMYIDSDNDLDVWAEEDVDQMLSIGSTESVNVVLLWDNETGPASVYHVEYGELVPLDGCELHGVETNMGDADTLREFVSYVTSNFQSKNFLLALWDHGDDALGVCFDYDTGTDMSIDYLTHQEIISALGDSGAEVDVLLFAACVLAMVEVAYEYQASGADIDYIVASEGYDPMPGFPWDAILAKLISEPEMTPLALATILVDEHIEYYNAKLRGEGGPHQGEVSQQEDDSGTSWWYLSYEHVTFSVIELAGMSEFVSDIKDMASAMILEMGYYESVVSHARAQAILPWSQNGWERIVDLPTLVKAINERSLGEVASASEDVILSLSDAVVHHRSTAERSGYEGMGVFLPRSLAMYENCQVCIGQWPMPQWSEYYGQMLFVDEIWLDFLNAYWGSASS
ncbi:MAG: hypothetical protein JSV94_06130 [Methanobacteriota archaeon]|nr:MAG: hypothetical protein JSV94_06130 [Euryarchaeota archaeon]